MRSGIKFKKKLVLVLIGLFTLIGLLLFFAKEIEHNLKARLQTRLNNGTAVISYMFTDSIRHTEFLMKVVNSQIRKDYKNLKYVDNIVSKYRVSEKIDNSMSWTMFTWTNTDNYEIVDAVYGILKEPASINDRDYIHYTKDYPDRILIGGPVIGATSKKWIIPAGVGAVDDKGNYIGSLTVGFDLNLIAKVITGSLKDENISFYLFDRSGKLLIDSHKAVQGPDNKAPAQINQTVQDYIAKKRTDVASKIAVIRGEGNYTLKKVEGLPFYIYVDYNTLTLKKEFWQAVTSRLYELIIIAMIAVIIAAYIYSRERKLRYKAEDSYQMALSASKGKTEFLAYTSHELRSPLNVIIFGSEMMKSQVFGELSPKYREYAEDIYQNGNDLLHFIEDLMDVTKADEEGSFSLKPEFVDINEIIDRVIKLNITRATKHKVRIEKLISSDLPKLWADSRRMRQILNNLISNAIKYSPENTRVRVVAHSIDGVMQIVIEDQGFGMTAEQMDIAMQRYGTVQNNNSGKVESIGLGLPLVKQLVDAHKGKFEIESEPGKGTTVTITFRLAERI